MYRPHKGAGTVKSIINGSVFSLAWVWSFVALAIAYWSWRQLGLPVLDLHLPQWAPEHPVANVSLRYAVVFSIVYGVIGGIVALLKGSKKVIFTVFVRIRSPAGPMSYEQFLQRVEYIRAIEKAGDKAIVIVEKARLIFGGLPLGLTWLAWCFALLGLLHLTVVPLALPEILSTFVVERLTCSIVFLIVLFTYFSLYYISFFFILALFYMTKWQWHDKSLSIFFVFLVIVQVVLFFISCC